MSDRRQTREGASNIESGRRGIGRVVVLLLVAVMVSSSFAGFVTPVAALTTVESGSVTTTALDPASETIALEPAVEWYQSYDGSRADSVVEADDGTLVVAQALDSGGDVRLLRVDATGATVAGWPKEYTVATSTARNPQIVVKTADGGFAVAGTTPFYVLKIDDAGTVQWLYQGAPRAVVYDVIQTSDGGYLAVGDTVVNQEMHVTKVDSNGNLVWNRTFPDVNYGSARGVVEADGAYAVTGKVNYQSNRNPFFMRLDPATGDRIPFADSSLYRVYSAYSGSSFDEVIFDEGRYVVAGWGPFINGNGLLVALDTAGNDEHLGTYTAGNVFGSIESTADGYALSGYLYPSDAWVVKTDKSGTLQWELFVGRDNGVYDIGGAIIQTSDGGYVLPGIRTDRYFTTYDAFIARLGPEPIDAVNVTIETPPPGAVVNTSTVTLAGTATSTESTVTSVEVSDDGGATFDPATTFDGVNWSYQYAAAGDDTYTLDVKATDAIGAFDSEEVVVTVDTTAPTIEAVALDPTLVAGGDPVLVTVSASDATDLTVTADGISLTQDANGKWTGTLTAPTTDGSVTVDVVATDAAGNQATASDSYTVDATAPTVTLSAPAENTTGTVEVTGSATDDNGIASAELVVDGTAQPLTLAADGSFAVTVTLDEGAHTLTLRATDVVGNTAETSTTVTVDLNDPPVADAGPDQVVNELTTVELNASGSLDADGDPLTYAWTQTTGPTVTLSDATAVATTFTAPEVSESTALTFEVNVSDGEAWDVDSVTVTVEPVVYTVPIDVDPVDLDNNVSTKGVIRVVVYGTSDVAVTDVVVESLRFGNESTVESGGGAAPITNGQVRDVDGDGRDDLTVGFRADASGLMPGDTLAVVFGDLVDGTELRGEDAVTVSEPGSTS